MSDAPVSLSRGQRYRESVIFVGVHPLVQYHNLISHTRFYAKLLFFCFLKPLKAIIYVLSRRKMRRLLNLYEQYALHRSTRFICFLKKKKKNCSKF
ncbi:hypothetical protein XELAEV_18029805mg [Xenopus laevis]|uniref:Uncharacterized protein n=1 Tax=Xenopus laevis TaxID=8355 RepID=A0A974CSU1_XENLA|nr:hypothetical protein XELAEV_18029805mg [Xenopus laevis]